jgi:hypothetical protein
VRPTIAPEDLESLFVDEPEPPTERRPDLSEAWARRMNDAIEVDACPACRQSLKSNDEH